jgi:hypothetical protein
MKERNLVTPQGGDNSQSSSSDTSNDQHGQAAHRSGGAADAAREPSEGEESARPPIGTGTTI